MARVKRGNVARNRRKGILKLAKGFRGGLSKLFRPANQAVTHALCYAFRDRRRRKRDFRRLWIARINGALQSYDISYSKFIGQCKAKGIELNRKVLSELAIHNGNTFTNVVEFVKG
jgi:large subunit ribosomal protein L20